MCGCWGVLTPPTIKLPLLFSSYVAAEHAENSASLTLEYAYDDWALSTVAAYLGQTADQALFFNRSKNYRNVFDPKNLFMCARSLNGTFL